MDDKRTVNEVRGRRVYLEIANVAEYPLYSATIDR